MDRHYEKLVLNGAPSQYDRWRPALDPRYAQPDDRSFPQLLNFATHYGSLINFYNLQNLPEGDWAPFFLSDTSMVLAAILALDSEKIERAFDSVKSATLAARFFEKKFELLRGMYEVIVGVARQINDWLAGLGLNMASETAQLLQYQLVGLIESNLGRQLRLLKSYSEGAALPEALRQPLVVNYQGFLPIWGLDRVYPDGSIYKGLVRNQKINDAVPVLEPIFWMFMDAVLQLKQFARAQFSGTLKENDHKPFLALYMTFAKLFETAQATLNSMSERYGHFYYREMLRAENKAAIPDQVYLTFVLDSATGASSATVPEGTLFSAGMDAEGTEILYGSEQAAFVTGATIVSLRNVRVLSGPLLLGASSPPMAMEEDWASSPGEVPQRILVSEISLEQMKEQVTPPATWPTFGSAVVGQSGVVETQSEQMGFAVASEYLRLTGGKRKVTVWFEYSCDCLEEIAAATRLSLGAILETVLRGGKPGTGAAQTLELFLSTAERWLPILGYTVAVDELQAGVSEFSIEFEVPASVAPVVPIGPEAPPPEACTVNATNPAPGLPTLKVYLRQDELILLSGSQGSFWVYPLSVMSALRIGNIRIATWTEGLQDLNLANTDGLVDATAPFPMFGAVPIPGSFLQLSNPELFVKVPDADSLNLTIRWYNLPPNQTGFAGYYQDYKVGLDGVATPNLFNNQTFQSTIQVVSPGRWWIESGPQDVFLFRTQGQQVSSPPENSCDDPIPERDGALCGATTFNTLQVNATVNLPPYYQPETSAIRLSLTAPPYGFGSDLYTKNVLHSMLSGFPVCQALWHASVGIAACLEGCAETPSSEYVNCVLLCLRQWQDRLLLVFQETFLRCLAECKDIPADTLNNVEEIFAGCTSPMPAERAHCIYDQFVASPEWLTGCAENCLQSCAILLEAVFWIEECNGICTKVDLSSQFNVNNGIVTDDTTFTGGMGNSDSAYSFEQLPSPLTYKGNEFRLGPPNAVNAVANATITLPPGHFAQLQMAALLVYPNQTPAEQTFTVTFSDNSTQTYTQQMSNWLSPRNYPGETIVADMPYRDMGNGTKHNVQTCLYGYSFQLDASKAVASLTLPATPNVIVMAVNLVCATNVDLSQAFTLTNCIVTNGTTFSSTGGLDAQGRAYSANLLRSPVPYKGFEFQLGPPDAADGVSSATITLPAGHFSELQIAGTAMYQTAITGTFTVEFSDQSQAVFIQTLSDWMGPVGFIPDQVGQTTVARMDYCSKSNGTTQNSVVRLYAYSFQLDLSKTVARVTLPANRGIVVLAMNLIADPKQCMIDQVTACSLKLQEAYKSCLKSQQEIRYPNSPWMPMAESVSLDYAAQCRFSPGDSANACGQFFYLLPFDGYAPAPASAESSLPLLPQFPFAGSLYLGFSNLIQPQTLSLLFQMAAGSAQDLPTPQWQYLSGNVWHDLEAAQIRSDTTNALKNSGVLSLNLPQLNSEETTVLPGGNQWLRATVPGKVERFAETGGIYPHVLLASWQDNGGAGEHLRQPLPPFTITSSVQPLADIAEIIQPMASFAGRARENDHEFKVSLGERLRHKDRALLAWDYETLVLDRFPAIWKAQELPARNVNGGHAPGDVLVVVVAGEESLEIADSAVPTAPAMLLEQIQSYLKERTSPFVLVEVVNPVYVRITVFGAVAFQTGEAAGARIGQLNSELVKYLSPWFYDAERAAKGGDYVTPDAITEFILNQPYVASFNGLELQYDPDPEKLDWYFLTSASRHHITEMNRWAAN